MKIRKANFNLTKRSSYRALSSSLISFIISMALGAFLIASLLQVFSIVRRDYRVVQNLTELNNSMLYATNRLYNAFSWAGYTNTIPNNLIFGGTLFVTFVLDELTSTQYEVDPPYAIAPLTSPYTLANSPVFAAQGNSNGDIRNCHGTAIAAGSTTYTEFTLESVAGRSGLSIVCKTMDNGGTISATDYLVYDIVETMWFQYGYDINNDGNVDYYYGDDPANKHRIRSVRVLLLLHSKDEVFTQNVTQTFPSFGGTGTRTSKYLYKVHLLTIPLTQLPLALP